MCVNFCHNEWQIQTSSLDKQVVHCKRQEYLCQFGGRAMPGCTLTNFDISIQGEKAPYLITARYGSSTANGEFKPSIVDPEWHKAYHTLAQSMLTPDADAVMAVGS